MKLAVCDDNQEELDLISVLLEDYRTSRNLTLTYKTFLSSVELALSAQKSSFDLYLLDVIMPALDGMELAREIRSFDKASPIIFLTTSPEFALESYTVKAADYLLKPLKKEAFFSALDEILAQQPPRQEACMIVKCSQGLRKIFLSQLIYAEACGRKVLYYLFNGEILECSSPFSAVSEELLKYPEFIRSHRSYLVNMHYISSIRTTDMELLNKICIPLAQRRLCQIKEQYLTFLMGESEK